MSFKLVIPEEDALVYHEDDELIDLHPEEGIEALAARFPTDCDFFKEVMDQYKPLAEEKTEKFRQEWIEQFETGEIELVEEWIAEDGTEYEGMKMG